MAVILTNSQVQDIVNEAYKQAVGSNEVGEIELDKLVDIGNSTLGEVKEQFTKALVAVVTKNWFTETSYRSEYYDPFFTDSREFGLITQLINVEVPEVQENPAWNNFVSGTSKVGEYTVYLPIVDTQYYAKQSSWALPITISWTQWKDAFFDAERMQDFVNYVLMCVDNAIIMHREDMNNANRNNAMAERLESEVAGCAINVVKEYAELKGLKELTVDNARYDKDFNLFVSAKIRDIIALFRKKTVLFNTAGKKRFTPKERLVVQILSQFETTMESFATSDIYHEELVKLPEHDSVPFWQGVGDMSFKAVSSISVKNGDTQSNVSGIIAFIADKWGVMHTIKSERVASQSFDIENLTLYSYQFNDKYMNDLTQNGTVLYMEDYKKTS